MTSHDCPPVLLIVFNRPETTRHVFARIQDARPEQLFIAADGPRFNHPGEEKLCAETRAVVDGVNWPCRVKTLFQEQNLGCRRAPSSAITWFFANVEEGIILEDDCLPDPSFFPFCAELLERFREEKQVFMVSGFNGLAEWKTHQYDYFFTLGNTLGWATWRRAWQYFDTEFNLWMDATAQSNMRSFNQHAPHLAKDILDGCRAVLRENLDAWDYQWAFTRIAYHGLGVTPCVNLVANIGFGEDATHTFSLDSLYADIPTQKMQFPLRHNPDMRIDFEYYKQIHKTMGIGKPPALLRLANNSMKLILSKIAGPPLSAKWTVFVRHLWGKRK